MGGASQARSRLDERADGGGQLSEEIWGDSGTRGRPFFLFPSSPMWKRLSVKRKMGADRTQRQHEGQVSYPPPDLKGKVNKICEDAMRKGIT